jgi:hypothetical protein
VTRHRRERPLPLWSLLEPDDRPVCGVEHEFEVRDEHGRQVDFRTLCEVLDLGRRLDPGDRRAARGPWGGVVTADGREAEVVTPPVPLGPRAVDELHAWTAAGRRFLTATLPPGHALAGYSTHISVAVPDRVVRRVADLVVRRFSPALMLLLDRPASPGLLVRPRPGRLEVCGEYADGRALRLAAAVVVATAELCTAAAGSRRRRAALPPRLVVRIEAARERFGSYVDRTAFGPDLYAAGRTAVLRTRRGTRTAGELLVDVVELLDGRLASLLAPDDLAALHAVAAGAAPLPLEQGGPEADDAPRVPVEPMHLGDRVVGGVRIEVVSATWWAYVLRLDGPAATRWLTVQRPWIAGFLTALDDGRLDAVVADLCREPQGAQRSQGREDRTCRTSPEASSTVPSAVATTRRPSQSTAWATPARTEPSGMVTSTVAPTVDDHAR